MLEALHFLTVVSAGVCAGSQVLVLATVAPGLARFPPPLAVRIHKTMLDHASHTLTMVPLTVVAIVCALAILAIERTVATAPTALTAVGLAGMAGVTVTTLAFNVPANRTIRGWRDDDVPAGHLDLFARWRRFHALRTLSGTLALAAFAAAALAL